MKYARIDIETIGFVNKNDKTHINFGDHLQNIIIKDLYDKMGIDKSDIYVLDFNEISTYNGEYLVLPINQAISHNMQNFLSPRIIPVFLGISRDSTAITNEECQYFRRFEPIGCRDEAVFNFLNRKGVDCYLNGCITMTMDARKRTPKNARPYVIEAPQYALDAMPQEIKNSAIFLENTCYGIYEDIVGTGTLEELVRTRYQELKENASVVITSRMHVASPCIGMGIPVVLVRSTIDYRFSWIDKYVKVYGPEDKENIDWDGTVLSNVNLIKQKIVDFSIKRIRSTYEKYKEQMEISEFYELRDRVEYDVPQFSDGALEYVNRRWSKDEKWEYAIWGENDASERLYDYLTKNYPNAKYVAFYDSYKNIDYHGIKAQHPSKIRANDNVFIFVTGYTATDAAKELFDRIGMNYDSYFLYGSVVRNY